MPSPSNSLPTPKASPSRSRLTGLGLAGLAAVCASSAGLLLRSVDEAGPWTVLVYRSVGYVAFMLIVIALSHRSRSLKAFTAIGRPGLVAAGALGVAFVAFILALSNATVASVVAILGSAPLIAALIALVWLAEGPTPAGWIAIGLAGAGVGLVVAGELSLGGTAGLIYGAVACIGYAVTIVALRAGADRDMTPALCLSGIIAGAIALAMADTVFATPTDMALGLALGIGQIGFQYLLIGWATRFASASDVALVMVAEIVLAPIWVWLVYAEAPTPAVLIGLGVVIAALLLNTVGGMRRARD